MGVLYARVAGAWVPIGYGQTPPFVPSTTDHTPAYIGVRSTLTSDARFSHVDLQPNFGFMARNDGNMLAQVPTTKAFMVWDDAVGTFVTLNGTWSAINGWGFGNHPTYGASYRSLWRSAAPGAGDYIILSEAGNTFLNVPAGGMLRFRVNNVDQLTVAEAGTVNYGPFQVTGGLSTVETLNATSLYSTGDINSAQRFWQQGGDPGQGWNQAQYVVAGAGYYGARIGMNYGGAAPQIRVGQWKGEAMEFIAQDASVYRWIWASAFQVESTIKAKKEVRSIHVLPGDRPRVVQDEWTDTVPDDLDVMALRPVAFRPKIVGPMWDPETKKSVPQTHPVWLHQDSRERLGLIAEEVATVIPSAVGHNADGTAAGLDYAQITVALLAHVQQLTKTIETLQYRITELENANDSLDRLPRSA